MKIIIFGGTGTGKSTLGKILSEKLNWTFLDSDDYYWEKTKPPFEVKVPLEIRNQNLKKDFFKNESVIVCGSLCTWSEFWNTAFDLGVFLKLPKKIRMSRLANRELERYDNQLITDKKIKEKSKAFLEWAENYDDEKFDGHSINQHRDWIKKMDCPIIEIKGNLTNRERLEIILNKLKE